MQSHDRQPADRWASLPEHVRDWFERLRPEDIKELDKVLEVSRAKRVIWDFLLKLAGAITVAAGAIYAVTQIWKGGPPN